MDMLSSTHANVIRRMQQQLLIGSLQVKRKLRRVVLMGGAMTTGNRSAVAEFNILTDPEAAQARPISPQPCCCPQPPSPL